jgi:SAM-dependent methyltransferase
MMHHLSDSLKRQGLAEIFRVLKPGGRLVIADFKRPEERAIQPVRFGAGGSRVDDLAALLQEAGFSHVETEEMQLPKFPVHSAGFAGFVSGKRPTA